MRKRIIFAAFMAFAFLAAGSAQDLDKILKEHFKAIGQKNLEKITSMQATGSGIAMGMEMPFTMNMKRPDKLKIIVEVQGTQMIQAVDGETVWTVNPMMGSSAPMKLSGAEAAGLIENADMDGQLWDYEKKGHQLELDGSESVNGKECHVLKLTKKNGNTDYYYMDKESYLIHKVKTQAVSNGVPMEVEAYTSNFQDVNGYRMPFSTEQRVGGQPMFNIELDQVEVNVEMDDSMFALPSGS